MVFTKTSLLASEMWDVLPHTVSVSMLLMMNWMASKLDACPVRKITSYESTATPKVSSFLKYKTKQSQSFGKHF